VQLAGCLVAHQVVLKGKPVLPMQSAVLGTIAEGKYLTGDLGGSSRTSEFTKAIIGSMQ
jgi:isocitrate/isopropylmalate dehydrogenase